MKPIQIAVFFFCALLVAMPAGAQSQTPSAAALAADPGARENSIRDGYSKPTSEIRAAYEHLDPSLFIYRPYYQGDNRYFYYVEADPTANISPLQFNDESYKWFILKAQDEYGVGWTRIGTFIGGIPGHEGEQVLYGEHAMHAGFAEVIADPGSSTPFNHFLHACSILDISSEAAVSYGGPYNALDKVARYPDGTEHRLVESVSDQLARNRRMKQLAESVIVKESPFGLLEFMADWIWSRYQDRQKKGQYFYIDAVEYLETYALMAAHRDLSSSDADVRTKAEAAVKKHKAQCEEVQAKKMDFYVSNGRAAKEKASQITKAQMPRAAMQDAGMEAAMMQIARQLLPDCTVHKILIKDAGWFYDKNALGQVTARYKNAWVVRTTKEGKTYMSTYSFKQDALGGGSFGSWQYRGVGTDSMQITDW
ncbi:MAG: hypothetical protein J6P46_07985 [Bacteroidales bacterium]|nr:hypothetical protein [Bacteroidales bacterium]